MSAFGRTRQNFPTRTYEYGNRAGFAPPPMVLEAGRVFRFVKGRDAALVLIPPDVGRTLLADPFAQLVLFSGGPLPLSAHALLVQLDTFNSNPRGLPEQRSFLVADGGQIPWTPETDDLLRAFRVSVTRKRAGAPEPDLLIATGTEFDSETQFLQVIGWDPSVGAFQFYERRNGSWIWAGSSWDALTSDSRGNGPFDSHVNGALNMKELKQPWVNWHSQAAQISDSVLAPEDPLRREPLWTDRSPAEDYELQIVRPGVLRWHRSRFEHSIQTGRLVNLSHFFRQVLETSTVNLVSSTVSNSRLATVQTVPLPLTFFLNSDSLVDILGLQPNIQVPVVPGSVYRSTLRQFDVALTDGTHRFPGDSNFVFVVPEPSFEDNMILQDLVVREVLSAKLAASLLMVDFCNPVFSKRRAALLKYVPESATVGNPTDFETAFVGRIRATASATGSAEAEFLAGFDLADSQWKLAFEKRIEEFFLALTPQLSGQATFSRIFEIAESRRREFRKRPLAEFRLTTPVTNIAEDAPLLEFTADARIQPKTSE